MTEREEVVEDVYSQLLVAANKILAGTDALTLAACMLTIALSMYKTTLPEEDFDKLIEGIPDKKDRIKTFEAGYIH